MNKNNDIYIVFISERAENNLDSIVSYLEKEWRLRVKISFLKEFTKYVDYLKQNPFMFEAYS